MTLTVPSGRFSGSALESTMRRNIGLGVDADLPDSLRFARGVAAVAKRRFAQNGELRGGLPIVFLLHPSGPAEFAQGRDTRRVPMLDNGLSPLGGSLWFVNYAVTEGVAVDASNFSDDAELFELVRETWQLGEVPAAILEARGELFELRFYPDGLSSSDSCERTDLARADITLEEIFVAINDIWEKNLCTPTAQTQNAGTWENPSQLIPTRFAEQRVQSVLKVGLGQRFKDLIIRQEQPQTSGRLDLEIEEPHQEDPSVVTRHAVLELKVLRAKSDGGNSVSPSTIDHAISEGLNQARAYRDERNVRAAALCCFDMRAAPVGHSAFDHVRDDALSWDVRLGIWHLFNSSAAYRSSTRPSDGETPEYSTHD